MVYSPAIGLAVAAVWGAPTAVGAPYGSAAASATQRCRAIARRIADAGVEEEESGRLRQLKG